MVRQIFGTKLGTTQFFDKDTNQVCVTVIEVEPACVLEKVSYPKGARAKIGCFKIPQTKLTKVKKPILGYFAKLGLNPYKVIREVEIEDENKLEIKKEVGVDIFGEGDIVNVRARTKGKGFQGGRRRHGWRGGPESHGSMTHRRIGSVGATTYPGRILKGRHMPGQMGNRYVTVKNLRVLKVDKEKNVLFVKGVIPGPRGSIVSVKKVKK